MEVRPGGRGLGNARESVISGVSRIPVPAYAIPVIGEVTT